MGWAAPPVGATNGIDENMYGGEFKHPEFESDGIWRSCHTISNRICDGSFCESWLDGEVGMYLHRSELTKSLLCFVTVTFPLGSMVNQRMELSTF